MVGRARVLVAPLLAGLALLAGPVGDSLAAARPTPWPTTTAPAMAPRAKVAADALRGVTTVGIPDGGGDHGCALTAGGAVSCWGWSYGAPEDPVATAYSRARPIVGVIGARDLSVGGSTCVITAARTVSCWGHDATLGELKRPTPIAGLVDVRGLSAGTYTTCAVNGAGEVWCWGDNTFGERGTGDKITRPGVTKVSGISGATQVSVGASHACARTRDGSAFCWGANYAKVLGQNVPESLTPLKVPGLTGVTQISAGAEHTCAVLQDGTAVCWGTNDHGELGAGLRSPFEVTPTKVKWLSRVTSVSAGDDHTCVVSDGHAVCWGGNRFGQLGLGTTQDSLVPAMVPSLRRVTGVVSGLLSTCARTADGLAWCWGLNSHGALGTGNATGARVPTSVVAGLDPTPVGGLSMQIACQTQYGSRYPNPVVRDPHDAYSWECQGSGPVDYARGCQAQYGPRSIAVVKDTTDPQSWECRS